MQRQDTISFQGGEPVSTEEFTRMVDRLIYPDLPAEVEARGEALRERIFESLGVTALAPHRLSDGWDYLATQQAIAAVVADLKKALGEVAKGWDEDGLYRTKEARKRLKAKRAGQVEMLTEDLDPVMGVTNLPRWQEDYGNKLAEPVTGWPGATVGDDEGE